MADADVQVEIEVKLDVPAGLDLPDLRDVPGVGAIGQTAEHHLAATYFDTADLRLARAGITLRRRTGGTDAGWHLKEPKFDDARTEVHRPLGRAIRTPPRALTDQIRVFLRDHQLGPVATVNTTRKATPLLDGDGAPLAEIADDHVVGRAATSAEPLRWREIEVELIGGDRDLLAAVVERLRDAGASPAGSASKLARVLQTDADATLTAASETTDTSDAGAVLRAHLAEQVAALMHWDPLARVDAPDAVHKMRVATRRLRSALVTFRPLVDRTVTDPLRDELKWLGQVLGEPRDEEVMHERLVGLLAEQPKDLVLGPVRRRIDAELRARHRAKHAELVTALGSTRYFRLLDSLDELAANPPLTELAGKPATKVLPARVAKARRRVLDYAKDVESARDEVRRDALLHEVRKAAKRARYAGEAVISVFGSKAARFAGAMEHLQEVLGEHQDSVVTQQVLRHLGVQAHLAGENGFTFGRLHGLEVAQADQAEAEYADALAAVAGKPPRWLR